MPTAHARARRMEIDDQDRVLVTEYRGNKVALFDTKTRKVHRISRCRAYTFPYRANFDKNGEIWASTMRTDRVVRLDPEDRPDGAISDAVRHQHAHRVRRQLHDAGDVLGRQQPRPQDRESRAARLNKTGKAARCGLPLCSSRSPIRGSASVRRGAAPA